jgi:taurine transport system permease protein
MTAITEKQNTARNKPRTPWLNTVAGETAIQASVFVVLLLAWEIATRSGVISPFMLPAPEDVVRRMADDLASGVALADLGRTLWRAALGFVISAVIGIPLGILMGRFALIKWFFDPLISVGFPMPKIAFLPIFILWFDVFDTSKIIMVVISAIFPIVLAANAGTEQCDKWPVWSARSLGASKAETLWEIIFPLALPQIMTGLQIALPVALITTIVTEMMMGGPGLGGAMMTAGRFADTQGVFAGIVEITIMGLLLMKGFEALRRRLLRWQPQVRE